MLLEFLPGLTAWENMMLQNRIQAADIACVRAGIPRATRVAVFKALLRACSRLRPAAAMALSACGGSGSTNPPASRPSTTTGSTSTPTSKPSVALPSTTPTTEAPTTPARTTPTTEAPTTTVPPTDDAHDRGADHDVPPPRHRRRRRPRPRPRHRRRGPADDDDPERGICPTTIATAAPSKLLHVIDTLGLDRARDPSRRGPRRCSRPVAPFTVPTSSFDGMEAERQTGVGAGSGRPRSPLWG